MDSLQSPSTGQRHKAEKDQFGVTPTALKAPPERPMGDPDFWYASPSVAQNVDVSAEETCPAPSAQTAPQVETREPAPAIQPAQVPSATTFELMDQLEALASDLADKERAPSDQSIGDSGAAISTKTSANSSGSPAVEPTIRVSPRPSGLETDQFAFDRPSRGGRTAFALASVFAVALVGAAATYAWQSNRVTTSPPDTAVDQASLTPAQMSASGAPAQPAPVAQTAPAPNAPATSPDLAKQLETMSQDLASVRRGIEQLTAKQEQLTAAQQQLEQLAAKQEQLAAKQEQMAQNIAKLQTREPTSRPKTSPAPQARVIPPPPRAALPEPPAQLSSAPRSESHPVPPLPVPR